MLARKTVAAFGLLVTAATLTACSDDAQERYDEATEALAEARENRAEAQQALQEKQAELEEFQDKLDEAEEELEQARENQAEAEAKVNASVTDEVLFRTLQRKMLNKDKFEDAAIAVGVADRVVTLTGSVPNQKTRKAALEIAREQSGVKEVIDFLKVRGSADDKNKNKQSKDGDKASEQPADKGGA